MSIIVEDRFLDAIDNPGKWVNVKVADVFSKSDIENIRKTLQQAKEIIEAFDSILATTEGFVSILKALESFINDILLAALLTLLNLLENSVNEFKSTGVYALDLISPFIIGTAEGLADSCEAEIDNFSLPKGSSLAIIEKKVQSIFEKASSSFYEKYTYEEFIEIIVEAFLDENDVPSPYFLQKKIESIKNAGYNVNWLRQSIGDTEKKIEESTKDIILNQIFRPGRPDFGPNGKLKFYLITISAFDFLQFLNIIVSFTRFFGNIIGNHGAIVELFERASAYYICLRRYFKNETIDSFEQQEKALKDEINNIDSEILGFSEIDNSFGPLLTIIGTNQPKSFYETFVNNANNLLKRYDVDSYPKGRLAINYIQIVKNNIIPQAEAIFERAINDIDDYVLINKNKQIIQDLRREFNNLVLKKDSTNTKIRILNSKKQTFFENTENDSIYVKAICGNEDNYINDNEVFKKRKFTRTRTEKSIDFYGMSAYQLFPELFELIEQLLGSIRSYAKPINTSISNMIQNIIDIIRQEIENLRQIISIIERIIQFIEDFLELNGISMLALDSDNGTYGLIQQLRQAQGFPGQNTGKKMYIAGIMVGIGYPNIGSDGIFNDLGLEFELQKNNIEGGTSNLKQLIEANKNNATNAINKFTQFFK